MSNLIGPSKLKGTQISLNTNRTDNKSEVQEKLQKTFRNKVTSQKRPKVSKGLFRRKWRDFVCEKERKEKAQALLDLEAIVSAGLSNLDFSKIKNLKTLLDFGADLLTDNPGVLVKFFESACREENRWMTYEQDIFYSLFQKVEDLKTGQHLNAQQIGKIDTAGISIFNTMPIELQDKFFTFFLSTLNDPKVIDQLKGDIFHCAKLHTIAKNPSNQENIAKVEKELLQIKDVDLRLNMVYHYAESQNMEDNILKNIAINASQIIPKIISYLELRDQNLDKDSISVGLCRGLVLLYCYYQFLGKESDFYDRINKILSIDIKQSDRLANKSYKDLSKNERKLEHLCNDILYLQGFPTKIQKSPVAVLSFVSDQTAIKKLSSQFQFVSCFSYDHETRSYSSLKTTLTQILRTDTKKSKFLILSTGFHVLGIFYQNNKCYLYDSNDPFQRPSFDFDTKDPTIGIGKLSDKLDEWFLERYKSQKKPLALGINILANKELLELKEKREALFQKINPGGNTINYFSSSPAFKGSTPLQIAANNGYLNLVELLIHKKADVDTANDKGRTPVYLAAQNGHLDVLKCLLDNGAKVDKPENFGKTPLWIAALCGHPYAVKCLLEYKAKVNEVSKAGKTPLAIAAFYGHLNVVKCLLKHKANINKANINGATPFFCAAQNGRLDVLKCLLDNGADVNKALKNGATPLLVAAECGHPDVVRYLLKHGAVDTATSVGQTALSIAKKNGHQKCVEELEKHSASVITRTNYTATNILI